MASYTCSNCKIVLKKGSWELVPNCPDCNAPWVVDPTAPQRALRRVQILATLFALLSFIPFVGLVFGILGLFWGYLAIKFKHVALGLVIMIISALTGLVGQPALIWHQLGQFGDHDCVKQLTTYGNSIRTYREKNGHYPESVAALKKAGLPAPAQCFAGGKYVYLPPWSWKVNAGPTTTSPSRVDVEVMVTTQPDKGPVVHAPAPSEPTVPQGWAAGIPGEYQAAFHAAKLDVISLPVPKHITEAQNLSTLIMAAEVDPPHRYTRMVLMADFSVREIGIEDYEKLLQQPQNAVFAKVLLGVSTRKTSG